MSNSKNAGQMILDFLRAKGKKARKAGTATTAEIAEAIGKPLKYTFDRLYWLEKREGVLVSTGAGKARVWRTTPKPRKAGQAAPSEALPPADGEQG